MSFGMGMSMKKEDVIYFHWKLSVEILHRSTPPYSQYHIDICLKQETYVYYIDAMKLNVVSYFGALLP